VIDGGTLARTAIPRPGPWIGGNRAGVRQAREVRAYADFLLPVSGAYSMMDSGDADWALAPSALRFLPKLEGWASVILNTRIR